MKSNYKIGDIITSVDNRNYDLCCNNLKGLSMTKEFRPSTSNIVGTDLSRYKIVAPRQFAVDFMSTIRVHRMPIALNESSENILVSPAYAVFKVIDENIILTEYLMMWFSRPEFDRYADFRSDAAIRGGYGWNELCDTDIYVPPIEKQRKIVKAYKAITDRITLKKRINDNLEATLNAMFCGLYEQLNDNDSVSLGTICSLASSKRVFADDYSETGIPFYRGKEITLKQAGQPITEPLYIEKEHFASLKEKYGIPMKGDILITAVGTIGNSYLVRDEEFYFKDGNIIWLKDFKENLNYYVYDFMQTNIFKQMLDGICIGSTQTALTIVALSNLQIRIPDSSLLAKYTKQSIVVRARIELNTDEISRLYDLQFVLFAELSR